MNSLFFLVQADTDTMVELRFVQKNPGSSCRFSQKPVKTKSSYQLKVASKPELRSLVDGLCNMKWP